MDDGRLSVGEVGPDGFDDAIGGFPIPERIGGVGHGGVGLGVAEELGSFGDDDAGVGTDQLGGACHDGFGAFGGLAQDQDGFAEAGGFFLDAAGVGEEQGGPLHGSDELGVVERLGQEDAGMATQGGGEGVPYGGVAVEGEEQGCVGELFEDLEEAGGDVGEGFAPVFPTVDGGEDDAVFVPIEAGDGAVGFAIGDGEEGIDDGVAGHVDAFFEARSLEVFDREGRGGEVELGQLGDETAVGFFGVGVEEFVGPQSGFDVADGDLLVEGGQGGGEGGRGVALGEDDLGFEFLEEAFEALEAAAGDVGQGLFGLHDG